MLQRMTMLRAVLLLLSASAAHGAKRLDPHGIFCGNILCYDVLEVAKGANDSEIKKNYRRLARYWHPDKNSDKNAKGKFESIAKAYQVLANEEERAKYDLYLKDPSDYIKQYGHAFFKSTAPPTDVTVVIVLLLIIFSGLHYAVMTHQVQSYRSKLVAVVVDDKAPNQGGSEVTNKLHKEAKELYLASQKDTKNKKVLKKASGAYKKDAKFKACVEQVCAKLGGETDPNLAHPTAMDTLVLRFGKYAMAEGSYQYKLTTGGELSDDQKETAIHRGLGDDLYFDLSDAEREELHKVEAWKKPNLDKWMTENGLAPAPDDSKKDR